MKALANFHADGIEGKKGESLSEKDLAKLSKPVLADLLEKGLIGEDDEKKEEPKKDEKKK